MILLETIHGSHLYGLSHENSDSDFYTVVEGKGKTTHEVDRNGVDTTIVYLDSFLRYVSKGSPQALEALFSRVKSVDNISLESIRIYTYNAVYTYFRTIKNFAHGNLKQQRHAIRLILNVSDLFHYGFFDPTLSNPQVDIVRVPDRLGYKELVSYLGEVVSADLRDWFLDYMI